MDNWVVIFVRTGTEEKIINILKTKLDGEIFVPFLPTREEVLKKESAWQKYIKPLFPGYIFVQALIEPKFIADELNKVLEGLRASYPFIRLLHYGEDRRNILVHEDERNFLEKILDDNYCVTVSKGFKVNEKIHITQGPLVGHEDAIKKIVRYQRKAYLDIEFAGELCELKLAIEIIGENSLTTGINSGERPKI